MGFNAERFVNTVKKHQPTMLHPYGIAIALVDMKIRGEVAVMRMQGKTDDEILKVIEPIFENCMRPLLNRE